MHRISSSEIAEWAAELHLRYQDETREDDLDRGPVHDDEVDLPPVGTLPEVDADEMVRIAKERGHLS